MTTSPEQQLHACEAAAHVLVAAAKRAPHPVSLGPKMYVGTSLFLWHLTAFERGDDPAPDFIRVCGEAGRTLHEATNLADTMAHSLVGAKREETRSGNLGDLYSSVYTQLSDEEYVATSRDILRRRLEANGIKPEELFGGKVVIDAGCGAGKFTQAIAGFGARRVIGVDIGGDNIAFAREQARKLPYGDHLEYRVGSVLELPVSDGEADFVWCNSVGHVTGNQDRTLCELARVSKPNAQLFYYVNGRFGLFEIMLKTLTAIMADVPSGMTQHYLQELGINPGRVSWIMACLFAPYEFLPRGEVETLLIKNGFTDLRLLTRGIPVDHCERIASGEPHATLKYGEGQLKFLARRAATP